MNPATDSPRAHSASSVSNTVDGEKYEGLRALVNHRPTFFRAGGLSLKCTRSWQIVSIFAEYAGVSMLINPLKEASMLSIRKAVFPVAGLGTRFLPATKASPKEM